jgi:Fe-S-cluster containining protein
MRCGECCRHLVGRKFGAAITPQEKQRLEILASRRAVNAEFLPLTTNGFTVTLWQFAQEKCPFLENNGNCMIYEWRPLLCKMYPLHPQGVGECPSLKQLQSRGYRIQWPPAMVSCGRQYIALVMPKIRGALKRYNLALGKWEWNRPFQVSSSLVNVVF